MEKDYKIQCTAKDGIVDGIPIVIGYVPIAIAFGILSKTTGVTIIESMLFSVLVFAGASQFIALNLLTLGAGIGEVILTTLLVNFRHFLMGASLVAKMRNDLKFWKPFIAFGITDEVFSIASFKEGLITKEYIIALEFSAYSSWVGGTVLGYLVGGILPGVIKSGMEVALYAMFAAILIPEIKKTAKVAALACLSGIINTLCKYFLALPQGWSIIVSVVLVSLLGMCLFKEEEVDEYE